MFWLVPFCPKIFSALNMTQVPLSRDFFPIFSSAIYMIWGIIRGYSTLRDKLGTKINLNLTYLFVLFFKYQTLIMTNSNSHTVIS